MKIPPRITISTGLRILCALAIVVSPIVSALVNQQTHAAGLTVRSLKLEPGATVGGSTPGGVVNHHFIFTFPTARTLGSITIQYCDKAGTTAAFPNCTEPPGILTTGATVTNNSGPVWSTTPTAYASDPTPAAPNNALKINKASIGAIGANTVTDFTVAGVTNPTAINKTFFVWITEYDGANGTGTVGDAGTVAASTARPIVVQGQMPESLVFCTADQVPLTGGGQPDCPGATARAAAGLVKFDKLFDPADTASATSQMAASTNAGTGYIITVTGGTLSDGVGNSIAAIGGTAADSTQGIAQFGLNLVQNTARGGFPMDPTGPTGSGVVGLTVAPVPGGTYKGQPFTPYDTNEKWAFLTGDAVAKSNSGGAGPSDAQIFTVSYIANVPGSQAAGTYSTTLTYVCTAYF